MIFRTFLRMGLRQELGLRNVWLSASLHGLLNLTLGCYFAWLSAGITARGLWTADVLWGLLTWMSLLAVLQQNLRVVTTGKELEFIRLHPVSHGTWLKVKLAQSLLPAVLTMTALAGLPLGWAYASGQMRAVPLMLLMLGAQFAAISLVGVAAGTYLGTDNDRSNTLFLARLSVIFMAASVMFLVVLGPSFARVVSIAMKPFSLLSGAYWYGLSVTESPAYVLPGLLSSGILAALGLLLHRALFSRVLQESHGQEQAQTATARVRTLMLFPPMHAIIRKDLLIAVRSWRQLTPALLMSLLFSGFILYTNIRSQGLTTQQVDPVGIHIVAAVLGTFIVSGVTMGMVLRALADDYEVLLLIRITSQVRQFVGAKILVATTAGIVLSLPFSAMLGLTFVRLGVPVGSLLAICFSSAFVTAVSTLFFSALRMRMGVHPRTRDGLSPFAGYMITQFFAIAAGLVMAGLGSLGVMAVVALTLLIGAGLILAITEIIGGIDLLA